MMFTQSYLNEGLSNFERDSLARQPRWQHDRLERQLVGAQIVSVLKISFLQVCKEIITPNHYIAFILKVNLRYWTFLNVMIGQFT